MKYVVCSLILTAVIVMSGCSDNVQAVPAEQNVEKSSILTVENQANETSDVTEQETLAHNQASERKNDGATYASWDDGLSDKQRDEQEAHVNERYEREYRTSMEEMAKVGFEMPEDVMTAVTALAREMYALEWAVDHVYRPAKDQARLSKAQERIAEINIKGQEIMKPLAEAMSSAYKTQSQNYSNEAVLQRNGVQGGTVLASPSYDLPEPTAEQLATQRKMALQNIERMAEQGGVTLSNDEIDTYLANIELQRTAQLEMLKAIREARDNPDTSQEVVREYQKRTMEFGKSNQELLQRLQMARFINKADEVKQETKDNFRRQFEQQNYSFSEYDLDQLSEINLQVNILHQQQIPILTKWHAERTDEQAPTEEEFPAEFKEIKIKIADLNREGQAITSRIYQTNPQAQQNHYQTYPIDEVITPGEIIEP